MIAFHIPGNPAPKGSKRGFLHKQTQRVVMLEQAGDKLKGWNRACYEAALLVGRGMPIDYAVPLRVCLYFDLVRPKGHRGKKGLRASAPKHPTARPDVDKLARAVLDNFKGILWDDDSQVVELVAVKRYAGEGEGPGCHVCIFPQE